MIIVWGIFLLAGLTGMASNASLILAGMKSYRWPKTGGVIKSSGIAVSTSDTGVEKKADIKT
jgi:hypothetical protein